MLLKPAVNLN